METQTVSIWRLPVSEVLTRTAGAVREVFTELPEAVRKGPGEVAEVIMRDDRRAFVGVALAVAALIMLLLS